MKKKVLLIIGVIIIVIVSGIIAFAATVESGWRNLAFEQVDMLQIEDGTYQGKSEAGIVYAKVEVTVKDHKIAQIEILEHRNGMGKKAEAITEDMLRQNGSDVDAVAGATVSSDVIKSAVNRALRQGEDL